MPENHNAWIPEVVGDWWKISGNPDLGKYQTAVYRSQNPLDFGVDSDKYLIGSLPYEVVRILKDGLHFYLTALNPEYDGIRLARMKWVPV